MWNACEGRQRGGLRQNATRSRTGSEPSGLSRNCVRRVDLFSFSFWPVNTDAVSQHVRICSAVDVFSLSIVRYLIYQS